MSAAHKTLTLLLCCDSSTIFCKCNGVLLDFHILSPNIWHPVCFTWVWPNSKLLSILQRWVLRSVVSRSSNCIGCSIKRGIVLLARCIASVAGALPAQPSVIWNLKMQQLKLFQHMHAARSDKVPRQTTKQQSPWSVNVSSLWRALDLFQWTYIYKYIIYIIYIFVYAGIRYIFFIHMLVIELSL